MARRTRESLAFTETEGDSIVVKNADNKGSRLHSYRLALYATLKTEVYERLLFVPF